MPRLFKIFIGLVFGSQLGYGQIISDTGDPARQLMLKFCKEIQVQDSLAALETFLVLNNNHQQDLGEILINRGVFLFYALEDVLTPEMFSTLEPTFSELKKNRTLRRHLADENECPDFLIGDIGPAYEGGTASFYKDVIDNMKWNSSDTIDLSQTKTFVRFILNTDGSISDAATYRGSEQLGKVFIEALQNSSGRWSPSYCNCNPRATRMMLPAQFEFN